MSAGDFFCSAIALFVFFFVVVPLLNLRARKRPAQQPRSSSAIGR